MPTAKIKSLWRYPVKSLLGEPLTSLEFDRRGVIGDRLYAISNEQGKFGSGKNTRRFRRIDGLFSLSAQSTTMGVSITFPDGNVLPHDSNTINAELSATLSQNVLLTQEDHTPHFDAGSVHILTSQALSRLQALLPNSNIDERRFRANIIIDIDTDASDDDLIGKVLKVGSVRLEVTHKTERCRMVAMAQYDLPHQPEILKEPLQKS